jgi:hypothetical protein
MGAGSVGRNFHLLGDTGGLSSGLFQACFSGLHVEEVYADVARADVNNGKCSYLLDYATALYRRGVVRLGSSCGLACILQPQRPVLANEL